MSIAFARSILLFALFCPQPAQATNDAFWDQFDPDKPRHLVLAEYVAANIPAENHEYASRPNFLRVPGLHDVDTIQSRNMCASFQTHILKISYDLTDADFKAWAGSTSPYAYMYFRMVEEERGFTRIHRAQDLEAGDFVFWFYHDDPTRPATGHAMMLAEKPTFEVGMERLVYKTIEAGGMIHVGSHFIEVDETGLLLGRPVFGRINEFE